MLSRKLRRSTLFRGAALVLPAAILATALAVTPSFAVSNAFKAGTTSASPYLTKTRAQQLYLAKGRAKQLYIAQGDGPLGDSVASTSPQGPLSSTTAVPIPGSNINLNLHDNRLLDLTVSGVTNCTASTTAVPCQVSILVDGQPASTGKVDFDISGTPGTVVHTATQTAFLTPGTHTISAAYAGSTDPSVNFTLKNWNLVVHAFPASSLRPPRRWDRAGEAGAVPPGSLTRAPVRVRPRNRCGRCLESRNRIVRR